jgi:hypothetical protein
VTSVQVHLRERISSLGAKANWIDLIGLADALLLDIAAELTSAGQQGEIGRLLNSLTGTLESHSRKSRPCASELNNVLIGVSRVGISLLV